MTKYFHLSIITSANEADLLNVALFGQTARQWRDANPRLDGNMRDYARIERLKRLNEIAIRQMKTLTASNTRALEDGKGIRWKAQTKDMDFADISNLRKSAQSVDKTSNDNPRVSASSAQSAFYFIPSAFICVHLRLIFVSLSDRIRKIRFKLFPVKPQIEQAINSQAHSCLNLLENKPQINADERRFVNLNIQQVSETYQENSLTESMQSSAMPVITYEKAAASRLRTRMTRICTDTFSSASFPQSAFYRIYSLIDEYKNPRISQILADNKNKTNLLVRYEFFFITPGCR